MRWEEWRRGGVRCWIVRDILGESGWVEVGLKGERVTYKLTIM
jgi:hypothetical protein